MPHDRLRVHGGSIAVRLARLRHDVADVDFERTALPKLLCHAIHEKVRHNARIETAGTEDDRVRRADRFERGRHRCDILRVEAHAANAPLHLRNMRLALDHGAVFEDRVEAHGLLRCGKHAPLNRENL